MLKISPYHFEHRKLDSLVENRTVYTLSNAELNVYETQQLTEKVCLCFSNPVLASMVLGKKVMHLDGQAPFSFYPGESVLLPANELMCIDFPEASTLHPTQCLALSIAKEGIDKAVERLNYAGQKENNREWSPLDFNYHFTNNIAINQILQRLLFVFMEKHPSKDIFSDLLLQELVIRVLQNENKTFHELKADADPNNDKLSFVIRYIKDHLTDPLSVEELSKKAYMCTASFYKSFKAATGQTPNDFIIEERLRMAENMLLNPKVSVKEACFASGFNSFSYFSKTFKKHKKLSPTEFKQKFGSLA